MSDVKEGRVHQCLQAKYHNEMLFYLSKQINQQVTSKLSCHEVVLFRDFLYWDYQQDFLKRYYYRDESSERILLLQDYFRHTRLFDEQLPRVIPARHLLMKRIKRRIKQQKKINEELQQTVANRHPDSEFLTNLEGSQVDQELEESERSRQISFQSEAYDIYGQQDLNAQIELKSVPKLAMPWRDDSNDHEESWESVSHLVFDFQETRKTIRPLAQFQLNQQSKRRDTVDSDREKVKDARMLLRTNRMQTDKNLPKQHKKSHRFSPSDSKVYFVRGSLSKQHSRQPQYDTVPNNNEYFVMSREIGQGNVKQERRYKASAGRLQQLRQKLRSLESRSSGLSDRISNLMSERIDKRKIDYSELMARIKATSQLKCSQDDTKSQGGRVRSVKEVRLKNHAQWNHEPYFNRN